MQTDRYNAFFGGRILVIIQVMVCLCQHVQGQKLAVSSCNLSVYHTRYEFVIHHSPTSRTSSPQWPGCDRYEGEDAISPHLSGFIFFDDQKFLLGHVQAYGIFCYELTDPMQPVALRRYVWTENPKSLYFDNQGQVHVFLYPKNGQHWDLILARSDTNSESAHLYRVYSGFEEIDYLAQNLPIRHDENGEPEIRMTSSNELRIHLADGEELIINIAR